MQTELKKTHKRDVLRSFEEPAQNLWESKKYFEVDAPMETSFESYDELRRKYPKFFGTTAYPYMNGRLHLGHAFSITKLEFIVGYERLKGKNALFPLGFHCTGMPIKACADKLSREIERFGKDFINTEDLINEASSIKLTEDPSSVKKHSKIEAKTGGLKYQYQILESLGIPKEGIHQFSDPLHWLEYFPPLGQKDLKSIGCKVDWRRSFITTEVNPYYDSFIRWQFRKLKQLDKIKFGARYTIFSPLDGQACMDHDRSTGEGIAPQEYTGIKLKVLEWSSHIASSLESTPELKFKDIYFLAATLRPETMYGQTNCFVGPDIDYGFFEISENEVFICTERAARNLSYQGYSRERGQSKNFKRVQGKLLVGTKVQAPFSYYGEGVYVLPMENVLSSKGTGVVTSVPSDSPDDFATLQDLMKKPAYYNIDLSWISSYQPVPIINSPIYGDLSAPTVCQKMKINSPKDKAQLAEAKEAVYKDGFYNGTMIFGEHKGLPVPEAKTLIRKELLKDKLAIIYNEPEGLVISRSGDECVVALLDQWYLDYGEPSWMNLTKKCLDQLVTYHSETQHQFQKTLDWLHEWACSRSFGLGTRLPWDEQFLIESLSDSTIYMAYYTISHLLQGDIFDSSVPGPLNIQPDQLTDAVWDYIFLNGSYPLNTNILEENLQKLKHEFQYFYPLDLRSTGKDLISNHLTFFLYNHTAIFPADKWPVSVRANGHILLNSQKMSKSTGNFMLLHEALEKYGADATRFALADSGDSVEDANFEETTANASILRLYTFVEWIEEIIKHSDELRKGSPLTFHDKVFENEMNKCLLLADNAFSNMNFREGLKYAFYELQASRDFYREASSSDGMNSNLIFQFIEWQTILLSPITPHLCEHIWMNILKKKESIIKATWPSPSLKVGESIIQAAEYIRKLVKNIRDFDINAQKKKGKKGMPSSFDPSKPKKLLLFTASKFPEWQESAMIILKDNFNESSLTFDDAGIKETLREGGLLKDKKMMPFIQEIKKRVGKFGLSAFDRTLLFNEEETLGANLEYMQKNLGFSVELYGSSQTVGEADLVKTQEGAVPGEPTFVFRNT